MTRMFNLRNIFKLVNDCFNNRTFTTEKFVSLNAFRNLGNVEVTLEFVVSLDAKAGLPFIASVGASSNLKIMAKWGFSKKAES